jgi:hypothetical protein
MKRVVYTCLFGHSELFNDFAYEREGIDFICFTDDPELRSDFWKIELLPRKILDPARASKKLKALPHIYLAPPGSVHDGGRCGFVLTQARALGR